MNPIPTWVRRLWDVCDLRVLVLLSFTLQLILSIFGNRRKYISSIWITVLVWSSYLTADWVATVALGKLSDVQGDPEKSNMLRAIWAPLLLLHLGGPDSITAYSLEDNQLWLRHFLGLVVQHFMAIYVILTSWKNSWFSFMSLPALVVGIIKYGERTWVLKSVSGENYSDNVPFGDLRGHYTDGGHEYVRVLILAHYNLKQFMIHLENQGIVPHLPSVDINEANIMWDVMEVQMGLMYDCLYTKATKIYSRRGCILRCISFGCTVTVLVGLMVRIVHLKIKAEDDQENWHEIDMAITGVLVGGALSLEIFAAIVLCSSNWGMLWLIEQGRGEWVKWLNQRFPWLFNKKKNWSRMMGQFDLVGYYLKVREPNVQNQSRKRIWSVLGRDYVNKYWNKYRHKNQYSVHPLVCNAILDCYKALRCSTTSDIITDRSGTNELAEFAGVFHYLNWIRSSELFGSAGRVIMGSLHLKIVCVHIATKICYHLEDEWDAGCDQGPSGSESSSWKQNKEVCKALSDYMMYLLVMEPSLLPIGGASSVDFKKDLKDPSSLIGDARNENAACRYLVNRKRSDTDDWSNFVVSLKRKGKEKRWQIMIRLLWVVLGDAIVGAFG